MVWVILSLLMLAAGVANSLVARKLLIQGVPGRLINFINFFCCSVFYLLLVFVSARQSALTFFQFAIIVLMSIFSSYLGNIFYMQSISRAPNPGYSLIIIKGNVVMVALLSVLFLQSTLSVKNILAIVAVLFFLAIIAQDKPNSIDSRNFNNWILPAVGTFFCFGFFYAFNEISYFAGR